MERIKRIKIYKSKFLIAAVLLALFIICSGYIVPPIAHAQEITDSQKVPAILGSVVGLNMNA